MIISVSFTSPEHPLLEKIEDFQELESVLKVRPGQAAQVRKVSDGA